MRIPIRRSYQAIIWTALGMVLALAIQQPWTRSRVAADAKEAEPARDPLADFNAVFRAEYARSRKARVEAADPVLLEEGGRLVLLHKGKRTEVRYMPPAYDRLKAVAHVPLGIYVMLLGKSDLAADTVTRLERYREKAVEAQKALKELGFEASLRMKLEKIVTDSLVFLDGVRERKKVTDAELTAFVRDMGKQLQPVIAEAARVQIDALDAQVKEIRKQLDNDDWKRLKVVLMGGAMPRKGQLCAQYFARLLGEPGEGKRIIYAESLWTEDKALNLLGTHLLDGQIGAGFFDDDRRMMRDLLADAAKEYLERK